MYYLRRVQNYTYYKINLYSYFLFIIRRNLRRLYIMIIVGLLYDFAYLFITIGCSDYTKSNNSIIARICIVFFEQFVKVLLNVDNIIVLFLFCVYLRCYNICNNIILNISRNNFNIKYSTHQFIAILLYLYIMKNTK